ncbi:MAG TPA: hypothetical protein VF763_08470 [Candidatus Limnocylindrales bacterium]
MTSPGAGAEPTSDGRRFAHASEAEFARILDYYRVDWEYEPQVFPLVWDLEGNVLESFAPDFYLPDLDLFVEMTTLQQRLVRKKNRKVRRLRELYPSIRIKLFYARDFRALMLKYGRFALADELSGTMGQATPPRVERAEPTEGALVDAGPALDPGPPAGDAVPDRPSAAGPSFRPAAATHGSAPSVDAGESVSTSSRSRRRRGRPADRARPASASQAAPLTTTTD